MEEPEGDAAVGHCLEDWNLVRDDVGFQHRREVVVLNDVEDHAGLVSHNVEKRVGESAEGSVDEVGDLAAVLEPHPEGHDLGGLARVTAQMQGETGEELAVDVVEGIELFFGDSNFEGGRGRGSHSCS